jgi:glycosyltransferase involved in cell wall biosynthesis
VAGALRQALDPARAGELRARGRARAATFTWERCAELTVQTYRRAVGGGRGHH